MLEQGRNQRKIEILEREADVEGADQVFLQRLDLDRRLHVALQAGVIGFSLCVCLLLFTYFVVEEA